MRGPDGRPLLPLLLTDRQKLTLCALGEVEVERPLYHTPKWV